MSTARDALLREFDQEMAATRRLLERVPSGKGAWKPHEKSFALGHLAQLIALMPGWLTKILTESERDLSSGAPYTLEPTETLLTMFDTNVAGARAALEGAREADFDGQWSLTMGPKTLYTDTRRAVVRQTISHLAHHRGQLTVYLRLLDVPIPSIYGPTADEGWSG